MTDGELFVLLVVEDGGVEPVWLAVPPLAGLSGLPGPVEPGLAAEVWVAGRGESIGLRSPPLLLKLLELV